MRVENSEFILLAIFNLREENKSNKVSSIELKLYLKIYINDRSQISQAMAKNEEDGYIEKEKDHLRFDTIIIKNKGINRARQLKKKFAKFFIDTKNISKKPTTLAQANPNDNNSDPFNDFIETIQAPLRRSVKSSLLDYIPEEHLKGRMVKDIAYNIQDCIYSELIEFFKDYKISHR